MLDITLKEQEMPCGAMFNNEMVMTCGFEELFGPSYILVALSTLKKIKKERVMTEEGADYLQVAYYDSKKFWVIDDGCCVTFLLPEEY